MTAAPGTGLTDAQAAEKLAADGPNQLRAAPTTPAWRQFLAQFEDPLVYLLLAAMGIALAAWWLEGRVGWPIDVIVIAVVVLLNAVLGWAEQNKARQAVAALARMTAATSSVERGGVVQRVHSASLVCGDLLVLAEGDAVGADARLLQADALRVQEASLTGESVPVIKDANAQPNSTALGDRLNEVFMGTAVAQGSARALVTATGMGTEMGKIAGLLDTTLDEPTHLEREVTRIGRQLGVAVLVIATAVVSTILALSDIRSASDVVTVLLLGVALAVAAVPEGLPAILSVVLALGVRRMAGHQAIIKKLSSVETLGATTVICTDKTGTLTRAEMTIEQCITAAGSTRITGVGYGPDGEIQLPDTPADTHADALAELRQLLRCGALAGNASVHQNADGAWGIDGDPTDAAFVVAQTKLLRVDAATGENMKFTRLAQMPFTSARKVMSTVQAECRNDDGRATPVLMTKGAPDVLLAHCSHEHVGADVVPLTPERRVNILTGVDSLSGEALRTLAVAYRPLLTTETAQDGDVLEKNLIFIGVVGMLDPPRPEVASAIAQAQGAGIRIIMITGDHPRTAARIGQDLGIINQDGQPLTGPALDAMDDAALQRAVGSTSVYARVSPANKLRIVAALQASGQVVAMTGDGVNDAPALKAANIGIAMGITGTEVAKEAAKVILVDDNFATLIHAVREGRTILDNIRKFLRYLLSSNMGEVLTVFLGVVGGSVIGLTPPGAAGVVLPLLATQILWLNLITDTWPALAISLDPAIDDVMTRPPRPANARVMNARMWLGIVETGLLIALLSLLAMDICLPGGLIEGTGDITTARTVGFTTLVFAHLFQSFNARSATRSAFSHLLSNPWLWGAIGLSVLLQVAAVELPFFNTAFSTVPLSAAQWALCAALGSGVLWFSEARKLGRRAWAKWHPRNSVTF